MVIEDFIWEEVLNVLNVKTNEGISLIESILEDNPEIKDRELQEEFVFRLLEDKLDWYGFDYSLSDDGKIDSSVLIETRCNILENVVKSFSDNETDSIEKIQSDLKIQLLNNPISNKFVNIDYVKQVTKSQSYLDYDII